jgi:hypothetical protein
MKKILLLYLAVTLLCSSCATLFGGKITNCQRAKPLRDQPSRKLRPVAFAFDVLFFPALIVDFTNCKIYKPCDADPMPRHGF